MNRFLLKIKSAIVALLLTTVAGSMAGCYYYDHDDRGYYDRRHDGRNGRYDDWPDHNQWDHERWDHDHDHDHWRGD
jgi:hypothetical protein